MRNGLWLKGWVLGIIILLVGMSVVPNITGNINEKKKNMLESNEQSSADVTITDSTKDVWNLDVDTNEWSIVNNSPYVTVDNLDIVQATYTQQGIQVTLSVQVAGNIENRGGLIDPDNISMLLDFVEYDFQLKTSKQDYTIEYCNETGLLIYDNIKINLTSDDFSVVGDTLTIWFSLQNQDEIYENSSIISFYLNANLSSMGPLIAYLLDIAPNPPLDINYAYGPDNGVVRAAIQFNASVKPLTGLPPYTYLWDFGDQGTSKELNPTHVYKKTGVYKYTFTVTDDNGATASDFGYITIHREGALLKAFLFGSYANNITYGDSLTFSAINLQMIFFRPPFFYHFTTGETITVSNQFFGIRTKQHLIGLFSIIRVSTPSPTPNISCSPDSEHDRLIVASADVFVKWRDIAITTVPAATWQVFSGDGVSLDVPNHTDGIVTDVIAGDYIQLTGIAGDVVVSLRYIPTAALLGSWTINV